MKKTSLLVLLLAGVFLLLSNTRGIIAQSGCVSSQTSAPTDITNVLTITRLGKFAPAGQSGSEPGDFAAAARRVREKREAGYDGTDIYNNASPPNCFNIESGIQPDTPRIAGPSSDTVPSVDVFNASDLRFIIAADEPPDVPNDGIDVSILVNLELKFYKYSAGVTELEPFYTINSAAANCTLIKGYYVISLTQQQINILDGEISSANSSDPDCGTYIYVGGSLEVERDEGVSGGEILYVGKAIGEFGEPCQFSINPTAPQTYSAGGGTGLVTVDAICLWTATSPVPWVTIDTGQYGSREVSVKYTVQPNTTGQPRSTTLTIAGQSLQISQSCMTLTPLEAVFGPNGGPGNITYSSQPAGCALNVGLNPANTSWITLGSTGGGIINYTVSPNNAAGSASRQAKIVVSGYEFLVKQAGSGGNCSGPVALNLGEAKDGSLTAGDCPSSVNSARVADRYSYNGTAGQQLSLFITNTSAGFFPSFNLIGPDGRVLIDNGFTNSFALLMSGTYIIELTGSNGNFGTYTVRLCSYTVTPATSPLHFPAGPLDQSGSLTVNTQGGCAWSSSANGWIPIVSGQNSTQSPPLRFRVQPNDSTERRVGAINVAGKRIFIVQDGRNPFDYTLTCLPGSVKIVPGSRGDIICELNDFSSYDTAVRLSCEGLPPGVTSKFFQGVNEVPAGGSVVVPHNGSVDALLRLSVAASVPHDTYFFTVTGTSGANNDFSTTFSMQLIVGPKERRASLDFDGDNRSDIAVWRPKDGTWNIINSSTGGGRTQPWGAGTDKLVPGDYDGDGKTDLATWRPSSGTWFIINSSTGRGTFPAWGLSSDVVVPADYDGDGRIDIAVWRPSDGTWNIINSSTGGGRFQQWGKAGDKPVPADYDGDGKDDLAVWRPSDSTWYIVNSTGGGTFRQWGLSTDLPVPADYDGDGRIDIAVWRPSDGTWNIINSTGGGTFRQWGAMGDEPVPADFDGDGKADIAVWRPTDATWNIINSTGGGTFRQWGQGGDMLVPADYDGGGKADIAVWRPSNGTWNIILSSTGGGRFQQWGLTTDLPVPADYDGDGKADIAIWRPSDGKWWIIQSTNTAVRSQAWGQIGDVPVPADYDGDGRADLAVWRRSNGTWNIINSSTGSGKFQQWGLTTDVPVPADYDGDGKADIAIWRPSDGKWWIIQSTNTAVRSQAWGLSTDRPVAKDYTGDRKADLAVWRPSDGSWNIINSTGGGTFRQWGAMGDEPVPADFDGDGKADIAVWRPSDATWNIINSSTGGGRFQGWGIGSDKPLQGAFIR